MSQASVPQRRRFTLQEYYDLEAKADGKHEFHDGEIVAMAGGSVEQSQISVNLNRRLAERLEGSPCQAFDSNLRIHIASQKRDVYPDAMVVCGPVERFTTDKSRGTILNPRVVFEILSPSTASYDRGEKRDLYLTVPTIDTYVLIEQDRPVVDILTRQADGTWTIAFAHGLDAIAKLPTLNIELPLKQLYDRVEFPATAPRTAE